MTELTYGNTRTFFVPGNGGGLLVDTDYAGTLPRFFRAIKRHGIRLADITYVMATHYHPDHMGLVGSLVEHGVRLLLIDVQCDFVHAAEGIFAREGLPFVPIDEASATIVSCARSRDLLACMGIRGEVVHLPSHSPDSVGLVLDDGSCLVGDLEPFAYMEAYGHNAALERDWERLLSFGPTTVFYAHRPEEH